MKEVQIPKGIIISTNHICLYCGEEIPQKYDEYTPYHECDCPDAVLERKIKDQIDKLKQSMPEPKFIIVQENVLYKINKNRVVFGGGISDGFEKGSLNNP